MEKEEKKKRGYLMLFVHGSHGLMHYGTQQGWDLSLILLRQTDFVYLQSQKDDLEIWIFCISC